HRHKFTPRNGVRHHGNPPRILASDVIRDFAAKRKPCMLWSRFNFLATYGGHARGRTSLKQAAIQISDVVHAFRRARDGSSLLVRHLLEAATIVRQSNYGAS